MRDEIGTVSCCSLTEILYCAVVVLQCIRGSNVPSAMLHPIPVCMLPMPTVSGLLFVFVTHVDECDMSPSQPVEYHKQRYQLLLYLLVSNNGWLEESVTTALLETSANTQELH